MLSLFAGRLVQLQGIQSGTYRKLAQSEQLQTRTLPAVRGQIAGADGQILAMTVQTYTVFADPGEMTSAQEYDNAVALEKPLGIPEATLYDLITHPTSPQYVILSKGVSTPDCNAIPRSTCRASMRRPPIPVPTLTPPQPAWSGSPAPTAQAT